MSFFDSFSKAIGTDSQDGFIGNIGKQLTQNDLVNNLYTGAGYLFGGPAGAAAANGLTGRAQGREWDQVLSNAAGAGAGAYGLDSLLGYMSGGSAAAGSYDPGALLDGSAYNPGSILDGGTSAASGGIYNPGSGGGVLSDLTSTLAGNKGLGMALGGLLGSLAGQDTTTSASKDPWAPAQPYLKANLVQNALMQDNYAKNPFSAEQKAAYQTQADTLANNQANLPAFNQIASNFMGSKRGQMAAMPGLLSGTKATPIDFAKYANIGLLKG